MLNEASYTSVPFGKFVVKRQYKVDSFKAIGWCEASVKMQRESKRDPLIFLDLPRTCAHFYPNVCFPYDTGEKSAVFKVIMKTNVSQSLDLIHQHGILKIHLEALDTFKHFCACCTVVIMLRKQSKTV